MFHCLRGKREGAVKTAENWQRRIQWKLSTWHSTECCACSQIKICIYEYLMAYVMSRVPLSQSECLLNKSMGVAQNVSAIAMRCCREQIANCFQLWTHCADRSRADVIYNMSQDIPIMLHAAKYSGATGSRPMQINNDQSRVENRVSRLENRQPVAMRKSISRLAKHIYLNGNHVEIMFS